MNLSQAKQNGLIRKNTPDRYLAKNLVQSSLNGIKAVKQIHVDNITSVLVFRESYESLRQICEAIISLEGYKVYSHDTITIFLREYLNEESISFKFDRYRKLRNNINYYGKTIDIKETIEARKNIILLIFLLRTKYLMQLS